MENILKSVSRSFYLSLKILPARLRPAMGLGYLLCRTADTIADTDVLPREERLATLEKFRALLAPFPAPTQKLKEFIRGLNYANTIPKTAEGRLMQHFEESVALFFKSPKTDQALIQQVVTAVIQGMEMDLKTFGESAETLKAFSTRKERETYLHLIGGEPGRFWTKACLTHYPKMHLKSRERFMSDGVRFGTGLQMVNILRDLTSDLHRGRCYIPLDDLHELDLEPADLLEKSNNVVFLPLYHKLIDDTLSRLQHGLLYIYQIPRTWVRFRAAVWWPLILGLKTLEELRQRSMILGMEQQVKVSRADVYGMIVSSVPRLPANWLLRREFNRRAEAASSAL